MKLKQHNISFEIMFNYLLTSSADCAIKNPCVLDDIFAPRGLMEIFESSPSSDFNSMASNRSLSLVKHNLMCVNRRETTIKINIILKFKMIFTWFLLSGIFEGKVWWVRYSCFPTFQFVYDWTLQMPMQSLPFFIISIYSKKEFQNSCSRLLHYVKKESRLRITSIIPILIKHADRISY